VGAPDWIVPLQVQAAGEARDLESRSSEKMMIQESGPSSRYQSQISHCTQENLDVSQFRRWTSPPEPGDEPSCVTEDRLSSHHSMPPIRNFSLHVPLQSELSSDFAEVAKLVRRALQSMHLSTISARFRAIASNVLLRACTPGVLSVEKHVDFPAGPELDNQSNATSLLAFAVDFLRKITALHESSQGV
jgi:hypothetical protein